MARPPKTDKPLLPDTFDADAAAGANRAVDALALIEHEAQQRTEKLALQLGYDGSIDPDVIERGVTMQMRRTVEACLETGRMLLLLKERVGHGGFIQRLDRLGVDPRAGQRFMQAALRLSNAVSTPHLTKAVNSSTKLLELLVLDDEQIEELSTDGSVLGISTDEIAAMSVKELRNTLRAKDTLLKKKAEAHDKLVLTNEALRKFKPKPDDVARTAEQQAMLVSLNEHSQAAQIALLQLATVANEVFDQHYETPLAKHARACLEFLASDFANLANSHDIALNMDTRLQPPVWLGAAAAKAVAKHKAG